ncbi:sugar transferase [Subtercola endophyticus]|uniref:sugar transferase n=1 Tax=Subtercola endophyticus TaxID=2895559 RepID=UPI0028BD5C53|nr:sugar transferase [Subtercola endophyticus]
MPDIAHQSVTTNYTPQRVAVARSATDSVAALLLLIGLAPVFAVTAVAVKTSSDGPVLFRQRRVGLHGRSFSMLKFRTMVVDAEARLGDLESARERTADASAGNSVLFKMTHDPRITSVGRFLRRYSIDELPQLVNVLRGDMSFVGPRPPLRSEVEHYEPHVHRRFHVKPGLTGLWQVSGRSTLSWEESVRLDLLYVETQSLRTDARILAKTARAVLGGRGAY